MMEDLVSTEWLADHLGDPDLAIIDATLFLDARDAKTEFAEHHIPGARFLDLKAVADSARPGMSMLPSAAEFADAMEALGVGSSDRIVVYDNSSLRSAVRGWFMVRHFGASSVAILDGGLGKWRDEGRPTHSGAAGKRTVRFTATERADVVAQADVLSGPPVVDARGKPRFEGTEPDPRPNVADGHIPGARNLPYAALWNGDGTMKSTGELEAAFASAGVDPAAPFTASCGSGVTANSLIFAAHRLGHNTGVLYDGSWSEWGADPATPKETGPA